jgi:thioredoxin-dependent peroxiredoxin
MSDIPQTGQLAPNFSIPDQDNHTVSLGDFPGQWVILYFYPKDDTPGCTTEAKDFTELFPEFSQLGGKILASTKRSLSLSPKDE